MNSEGGGVEQSSVDVLVDVCARRKPAEQKNRGRGGLDR
jgi:hypothetical protein